MIMKNTSIFFVRSTSTRLFPANSAKSGPLGKQKKQESQTHVTLEAVKG